MDYSPMPLQVLRRLEKARDTTISWILKEIDKVEEELQQQKLAPGASEEETFSAD